MLTGGGEEDVVDDVVKGGDSLHDDLRVVHVLGGEARPVADGQHGIRHERVVLHELQGLIRQQQRVGDVLRAVLVVNALRNTNRRTGSGSSRIYKGTEGGRRHVLKCFFLLKPQRFANTNDFLHHRTTLWTF